MILSRKLSDALNEQINMEMWSSNLYLSMSVHFTQIGLDGFAHWTLKQSQEELEHAYKICLLYTSPSPRDVEESRMPSSA